jgi:hypothetical protein
MSDARMSRRLILPTLAAGAAAAAIGASEAQAADGRYYAATSGPAPLSPGNALVFEGALPAVQTQTSNSMQFRLTFQNVQGKVLAQVSPVLRVGGQGFSYRLSCLGDGSVRLGDQSLNYIIRPGTSNGIIAILIGLLLPAVQPPTVSVASLDLMPEGGVGRAHFILPFIEQNVVQPA